MSELLLGCGYQRTKFVVPPGGSAIWDGLVTLDSNKKCDPDILANIDYMRGGRWRVKEWVPYADPCIELKTYQLKKDYFKEVHAYEVLEHLGNQGHVPSFFHTFNNIYRILCDGGFLCATVPSRFSPWLWGDPGHRRVIYKESLAFVNKKNYEQIGITTFSDYSDEMDCDFRIIKSEDDKTFHTFILQALKK